MVEKHFQDDTIVDQEPSAILHSSKEIKSPPQIPIVDFKSLLSDDESSKTSLLEKLHSTCKEWGILQLVNHGVDPSLLEKVRHEVQGFYRLPMEERLKYKVRPGDVEGYGQTDINSSSDQNDVIDWVERFYMTTNPIHRRKSHLFPELPNSLRETLETYISELQKLSRAILELIAESLKIDKREVEDMFEDGMQALRMNCYPPYPQPDEVMGLKPHSDSGGITILLQVNGVEGLQVRKDGLWIPANFLPDAFIVNLGDIIEIFSNGVYKSIEHRATVNSKTERISIAMFFNPKFEAQVGPSPSLFSNDDNNSDNNNGDDDHQQQPLFRGVKMEQYVKEFFSRRLTVKTFLQYMKI